MADGHLRDRSEVLRQRTDHRLSSGSGPFLRVCGCHRVSTPILACCATFHTDPRANVTPRPLLRSRSSSWPHSLSCSTRENSGTHEPERLRTARPAAQSGCIAGLYNSPEPRANAGREADKLLPDICAPCRWTSSLALDSLGESGVHQADNCGAIRSRPRGTDHQREIVDAFGRVPAMTSSFPRREPLQQYD